MRNPWTSLPTEPCYVLPEDWAVLGGRHYPNPLKKPRFDVPPAPFAGDPAQARVLLLLLNPGFKEVDVADYEALPAYRRLVWESFSHASDPPLWMLSEEIEQTGAFRWTHSQCRWLIERCGIDAVRNRLMQVQYFPYKSTEFDRRPLRVPSQQYSFELVRRALRGGRAVVVVRGWDFWSAAVPELQSSACIRMTNRSAALSPGNMGAASFERVATALGG